MSSVVLKDPAEQQVAEKNDRETVAKDVDTRSQPWKSHIGPLYVDKNETMTGSVRLQTERDAIKGVGGPCNVVTSVQDPQKE
jgi:hypothetical protein